MEPNNINQVQDFPLGRVDGIADVSTTATDTFSSSSRTGSSIRESDTQALLDNITTESSDNAQAKLSSSRMFDDFESRFGSSEALDFLENRFGEDGNLQDRMQRLFNLYRDQSADFDGSDHSSDRDDSSPIEATPPGAASEQEDPPITDTSETDSEPEEVESPVAEAPEEQPEETPPVAEAPEESEPTDPETETPPVAEAPEESEETPPIAEAPEQPEETPPVAEAPEESEPTDPETETPPVAETPEESEPTDPETETPPVAETPEESEEAPPAETPEESEPTDPEGEAPPVAETPEEQPEETPPVAETPEESEPTDPEGEAPPVAETPEESEETPPVAEAPEESEPTDPEGEAPPVAEAPEESEEAPPAETPEESEPTNPEGEAPPIAEAPEESEPTDPEGEAPPVAEAPEESEEAPPAETPEESEPTNPEGEAPPAETPEESEPTNPEGETPPVAETPEEQPEETPPVAEAPEESEPTNPESETPPVAETPEEQPEEAEPTAEQPQEEKSGFHIDPSKVASQRSLNADQIDQQNFREVFRRNSDILAPRGGVNTIIGSGSNDVVLANTAGSFNTITTGNGSDSIILGDEATSRVFDFNPSEDKLVLTGDVAIEDIVIGQGTNQNRGGLQQPLDNLRHTLVIDRSTNHILASLQFTASDSISESDFVQLSPRASRQLSRSGLATDLSFFTEDIARSQAPAATGGESGTEQGSEEQSTPANEHNHSAPKVANAPSVGDNFNRVEARNVRRRSLAIGGDGNDFIRPNDSDFSFGTARGGGQTEFPFATDSPGTSELAIQFANDVLTLDGTFENFDGEPLFVNGETTIAEEATNLSLVAEQALLQSFLAVEQDSEGNARTGTHLHFSPAGDSRANAADATVVRFLENTVNEDGKSGTFSGEFNLSPEEQAALAAGNFYVNIHTNQDGDGDGKGGFITGENRLNINQNVVRIA